MFEQHPVPQQISSYQFRLVGDMTLKQFFQLAAGAILGLVTYATPLPGIFKWPLIVLFVVAGAAFAFLPLQERPLEEWMAAFFRAIYGPTLFRWEKTGRVQYFASVNSAAAPTLGTVQVQPPPAPVTAQDLSVAKLEERETTFLSSVIGMVGGHNNAVPVAVPATPPVAQSQATTVPTAQDVAVRPAAVTPARVIQAQVVFDPTMKGQNIQPSTPVAGSIPVSTPQIAAVKVERQSPVTVTPITQPNQTAPVTTTQVKQTFAGASQFPESAGAQFSLQAAPPAAPTTPNIVVGQVTSAEGKIVEGAIIEVMDFQGRPVRAFKTNKAGHFFVVTPLPNGQYKMIIEKEGLQFAPVTFEAHGAVIPPIAIKGQVLNVASANPATN